MAIFAMRTNAIPPTKIAPTIANTSRQLAKGTPMWARTSVEWAGDRGWRAEKKSDRATRDTDQSR